MSGREPRSRADRGRTPRARSAGAVVVRPCEHDFRFLLLRAYSYWDFPKGGIESGERALDAACREVEEETTLKALEFPWGFEFQETPPYGRGKVARYYLALSREGPVSLPVNPVLGHPEHHEFRWLDYASARTLLNARLQPILDWAYARIGSGPPQ